jgi:hypothetical protein
MISELSRDQLEESLDQKLASITTKTNDLTKLLRQTEYVFTAVNEHWSELKTKLVSFNKNKIL